ncbi:hypothetical protein [Candidatus Lokiarchaeum ossiferum]|uniref:hypothetical protein n=1 Tax=Candidatus Lokiarchaeum ossiferum TaxID=2951803 RepID=UPI00352E295F
MDSAFSNLVLNLLSNIVSFMVPMMVWYAGINRIRNKIKNPYSRILFFSFFGISFLYLIYKVGILIVFDKGFFEYKILFISAIWMTLTYSQLQMHVASIFLQKEKTIFMLGLHFLSILLGLTIILNGSTFTGQYNSFLFIGWFLVTRGGWFILNQLIERIFSGVWASYNIIRREPNLVLAIHFRMTFFTKILNTVSERIYRPKLKKFFWIAMILATLLEFLSFFLFLSEIYYEIFSYRNIVNIFIFSSMFMSFFHEWGHLIAAKMNGGFGVYVSKLNSFLSVESVQIPLLLFTPKQRIKIALMGTLWANLIAFIPTMILCVISYLLPILKPSFLALFVSAIGYYAILSSSFFILALWTGGDMNNIIRDLYLIFSGKNEIPKSVFGSENEVNFSSINQEFEYISDKRYKFSQHIILRPVDQESCYILDEINYSAFLINDVAHEIIKIMLKLENWTMDEILTSVRKTYEFEEGELVQVIDDITDLLAYLGKRGYLTEWVSLIQKKE